LEEASDNLLSLSTSLFFFRLLLQNSTALFVFSCSLFLVLLLLFVFLFLCWVFHSVFLQAGAVGRRLLFLLQLGGGGFCSGLFCLGCFVCFMGETTERWGRGEGGRRPARNGRCSRALFVTLAVKKRPRRRRTPRGVGFLSIRIQEVKKYAPVGWIW